MKRTAGDSGKKAQQGIRVQDLTNYLDDWNLESQLRKHTAQSVQSRKARISKFFWFLEHKGIEEVGTTQLKQFFLYLNEGHLEPGGRWDNRRMTEPMRPISVHAYFRILKAFFNFLVSEEIIDSSPMAKIKPPSAKTEIKQPVSEEHIQKLLRACKKSRYHRRDEAVLLLLVDTGLRASELCQLKREDLDLQARNIKVLGKGNKYRTVFLGLSTTKALNVYLRNANRRPCEPLFLSHFGKPLQASGLFQLIERLSNTADIPCPGVHALRRTFAVSLLKSGANVFTVQTLLGHSDLTMTKRYCRISDADCEEQHRQHSPADRLGRR